MCGKILIFFLFKTLYLCSHWCSNHNQPHTHLLNGYTQQTYRHQINFFFSFCIYCMYTLRERILRLKSEFLKKLSLVAISIITREGSTHIRYAYIFEQTHSWFIFEVNLSKEFLLNCCYINILGLYFLYLNVLIGFTWTLCLRIKGLLSIF